jgi:sulfofructose kinase
MPEFDVVGVGLNATDTVLMVPAAPQWGGKVAFTREFYSVGGQVATAMVACSHLGLRAKYIGAVGDDIRGQLQMESLRQSSINIDQVIERRNCPNQSAYIVIDQSTGERTVFWNRAECLALAPEEIAPEHINCAAMLHIDGHDTDAVRHAAGIARAAGIPVSMDADTMYRGLEFVFPLVDYLIASAEFPAQFTGIEDPFAALQSIQRRYGMRVAGMTLGKWGALAYTNGGFHYSPGFVVHTIDTTGAGDVFHGAFCYSVIERMPIREAMRFSNAMAALNCTAPGARGAIASVEEANQLIARAERRSHPEIARRAMVLR